MKVTKTAKKLTGGIITIIVLTICLCITTFALFFIRRSVDNNMFHTGSIKINLNDGKPVIKEHEFIFEPGMTVKKDFFIENKGTWDVYYKLYFKGVEGGLADVLEITIKNGDEVLYKGTASKFNKDDIGAANDILKFNERKDLSIYFHYPETATNNTQNLSLAFDFCADAVQTKNNPNKAFE